MHTDDELFAEVLREWAIESGEIVGQEDDKCEEEELEMGIKDILVSMTKLRKALLSRGDICVCTAKMLVLAQDKVA